MRRYADFLWFVHVVLVCMAFPTIAQAAEGEPAPEPWYKIVAGIIAVPAAIIGLAVSYRLFRKTNLESRKLELEISEKERQLQSLSETAGAEALRDLVHPMAFSQRLFLLILRFIILELTLRVWSFVPTVIGYLTGIVVPVANILMARNKAFSPSSPGNVAVTMLPTLVGILFDLVHWSIVFGFGWPLLRDACGILGIRIARMSDLPFLGRRSRQRDV